MRRMQYQPLLVDCQRQRREQAWAIRRLDFDHGEPARGTFGHRDRRCDWEGGGGPARGKRGQCLPRQRRDHRLCEPLPSAPIAIGPPLRIVDQQIVERHAVAGGVDSRIDDLRPRPGQARADPVEQSGAVLRKDADARRALLLTLDLDARRCLPDAGLGGRHLAGIGEDPVSRLGQPVAVGQAAGMGARRLAVPVERLGQRRLARRHLLAPPALLVAEPKPFLGRIVKRPDQPPLPFGPDPRPHRANIDHGQDQQQPQALRALHQPHERIDRLRIGKVALERGVAEQKMMPHQPGDDIGLPRVEPEARAELARDLLPQQAVVAASAFGDVVKEYGHEQRAARPDLLEQGRRQRVILGQFAPLDRRQQADRADRMLVDRIVMVHVELHLPDHPAEIGDEPAEHACLVHPAQHELGRVATGQHFQKQGIGRGIVAQALDEAIVAGCRAHRGRVNFQPLPGGGREYLEQAARFLAQKPLVR